MSILRKGHVALSNLRVKGPKCNELYEPADNTGHYSAVLLYPLAHWIKTVQIASI